MYQQFEGSFESIGTTCEALEQKRSPKLKYKSKEIKLSFLFHSICLDEFVILVHSFVKIK